MYSRPKWRDGAGWPRARAVHPAAAPGARAERRAGGRHASLTVDERPRDSTTSRISSSSEPALPCASKDWPRWPLLRRTSPPLPQSQRRLRAPVHGVDEALPQQDRGFDACRRVDQPHQRPAALVDLRLTDGMERSAADVLLQLDAELGAGSRRLGPWAEPRWSSSSVPSRLLGLGLRSSGGQLPGSCLELLLQEVRLGRPELGLRRQVGGIGGHDRRHRRTVLQGRDAGGDGRTLRSGGALNFDPGQEFTLFAQQIADGLRPRRRPLPGRRPV